MATYPNHARSLLINKNGGSYWDAPGEEYVSAGFKALETLPSYLRNLRVFLFGADPDRFMLNYRTRQLMQMLHATELVEYVTDLDPRITYTLDNSDLFDPELYKIADTSDSGAIEILTQPEAPDATGRAYRAWQVERYDASQLYIRSARKPFDASYLSYTVTDDLSSVVTLPGSQATFRFYDSPFPVASSVQIAGYTRPVRTLGEIAANIETSGRANLNALFHVGDPEGAAEPYTTFRALWEDHPMLPYKLGGLVLAMIYRTEEIRTQYA